MAQNIIFAYLKDRAYSRFMQSGELPNWGIRHFDPKSPIKSICHSIAKGPSTRGLTSLLL